MTSSRREPCLGVLAAATLLSACPSFTTVGSARTLDAHQWQWVSGLEVIEVRSPVAAPAQNANLDTLPLIETGVRYGVTPTVELGGKFWPLGLQADVKVALLRPPSKLEGWNLSINPALSGESWPSDRVESASLNGTLLLGYRFKGHELLFAPGLVARFVFRTWSNDTLHDYVIYGRAVVGLLIRITRGLAIQPEVGVISPFDPSGSLGLGFAGPAFQGTVGFIVGSEG
jgi:hypothetical protein